MNYNLTNIPDSIIKKSYINTILLLLQKNILYKWMNSLSIISTLVSVNILNLENENDDKNILTNLLNIENEISKLTKLIREYENLCSQNEDKAKNFNSDEIIDIISTLLTDYFIQHNIHITYNVENISFVSYYNEVIHIIVSLIYNSIEAFKMNEIENKQLSVNIYTDGLFDYISIKDNAGGIKNTEKLFSPFFTTKEENHSNGLSLYIIREIVEDLLDGEISYENIEDTSLFTIKLIKTKG